MNVSDKTAILDKSREFPRASLYALGIVLLAAILRFYHLGSENLWIDEGFSLRDAVKPDFLHETRPLYFLFLHYWLKLGAGHSEFMLRLPAAIFGIAGVWALFAVGRRLMGASVAVLASAFMAISVLHINHSIEVRYYSLVVLLSLLSTYFLIRSLEEGKARYIAAYVFFGLTSVLAFPLSAFTLAAQGLFVLIYAKAYRPKSLALLGVQIAVLLAWVPWLRNNMQTAGAYSEGITSIHERPDAVNTLAMLGKYFLWKWYNPGHLQMAAALGFSALVMLIALYGLRGLRRTDTGAVFTWLWLVFPMLTMAAACYSVANVWLPNYLICISPAFFLLVAKGIHTFKSRYVAVAATLMIVMVTFARLGLYYKKPTRPEWRPAVQYLQSHERAGDIIGIYDPGNQYAFDYYYNGPAEFQPMGAEALTSDRLHDWTDDKVRELFTEFPATGSRFWLVLCNHTYAGGFNIIDYVRKHYRVLDHQSYNMVEVYLFDAKGRPVPIEGRGRDQ